MLKNINPTNQQVKPCEISYISDNNHLLKNILLTAHEPYVNKPIVMMLQELREQIQTYLDSKNNKLIPHAINEIYNNACRLFIALGKYNYACELCYSFIELLIHEAKKTKHNEILHYTYNPWMTLIRIDRLEGCYHAAYTKISAVNFSSEVNQLIQEEFLTEQIQLCLSAKHYHELIHHQNKHAVSRGDKLQLIRCEGMIIALANSGKISQALHILKLGKKYNRRCRHIFVLREFELVSAISSNTDVESIKGTLDKAITLLTDSPSVSTIQFALHAANIIKNIMHNNFAIKLGYYCLAAALACEDQVLQSESLVLLYSLVEEAETKKLIEDMMIELYFKSQYVSVHQLLLAHFADLKYVELSPTENDFESLFEYLLALTLSY